MPPNMLHLPDHVSCLDQYESGRNMKEAPALFSPGPPCQQPGSEDDRHNEGIDKIDYQQIRTAGDSDRQLRNQMRPVLFHWLNFNGDNCNLGFVYIFYCASRCSVMFDRQPISTAPKDGTFVRLYFKRGFGQELLDGTIAQWQAHEAMPAGGAWFCRSGSYITCGTVEPHQLKEPSRSKS
jgi:hypothetical protein